MVEQAAIALILYQKRISLGKQKECVLISYILSSCNRKTEPKNSLVQNCLKLVQGSLIFSPPQEADLLHKPCHCATNIYDLEM